MGLRGGQEDSPKIRATRDQQAPYKMLPRVNLDAVSGICLEFVAYIEKRPNVDSMCRSQLSMRTETTVDSHQP